MENPVFHFAECLWMMSGRDDSEWISKFNPRMRDFANESGIFHGAYGYRWRILWGIDQILAICNLIKKDPWTRRAVISMWDTALDLDQTQKDLPCNTHIYFRRNGTSLDMTVCNRSNDLVWGALGSNIVHFSFLMELIAHEVGLEVGKMYQFTNNLHVYERHWHFVDMPPYCETYHEAGVKPYPLIQGSLKNWLQECEHVVAGMKGHLREPFFNEVAMPILNGDYQNCQASDWRLVCERYRARKESI